MNARTVIVLAALAAFVGLAGCNTIEGVGKDVNQAGTAIENAAKKNK